MRKSHLLVAALLFSAAAACHGSDPSTGGAGSSSSSTPSTMPAGSHGSDSTAGSDTTATGSATGSGVASTPKPTDPVKPADPPPLPGHDFTPVAKDLLAVGACADLPVPADFPKKLLDRHCNGTKNEIGVKKAQQDYLTNWVAPAGAFFAEHVPKDVPKHVVYPFSGGDLSTALTVYPDAEEITTISLEPAGDPRDLAVLKGGDLSAAIDKAGFELRFLYRVNFSNTSNMHEAMRQGSLPTELIFALSAFNIHGYEVLALRYFRVEDDGSLHYLDDADIAKIPTNEKAGNEKRNNAFSDMEIQFRKPGGAVRTYRHIRQDLDDDHLKANPGVMKFLEGRGAKIAAMTKAASYLLSMDSFKTIRDYLIAHVQWMVSDATGIAPRWGKKAGFEYETWGTFAGSHLEIGKPIEKDWKAEFDAEPKRDLGFRFGYYDRNIKNHMIIIKKQP